MLAHAYNIIIDHGVRSPVNVKEVVDGLNNTGKWLLYILMTTVQLSVAADYESQTGKHTSDANTDISLAREFKKHISDPTQAHYLLYHGKDRKHASKQIWTDS